MRSGAGDTSTRRCVRYVLCPNCIPLGLGPWLHQLRGGLLRRVRRLHSYYGLVRLPTSVHHRLRLLTFPARTAGIAATGQTWDLPVSDALLLHVICSSTRAGRQCLAITAPLMWRSAAKSASVPSIRVFPGSITHPMQPLCTLRGSHCCRLAQHSLPGGSLRPTWAGLPPADRASSLALSFAHPTLATLAASTLQPTAHENLRAIGAAARLVGGGN